jgi:hypothetical protein
MYWWIGGIVLLFLATRGAGMAFAIKPGVFGTLKDVMHPALDAVQQVWAVYGLTPVITSIEDGVHSANSKHYDGLAFDIRLNDIDPGIHASLARGVELKIGGAYDVVHESHGTANDHLHVEYDPR